MCLSLKSRGYTNTVSSWGQFTNGGRRGGHHHHHHHHHHQQQHRTLALYILQLWNHRGKCWRDSQCWDTPNGSKWLDLGSKVKVSPYQRLQAMCSSPFWNTLNTSSRVFQHFLTSHLSEGTCLWLRFPQPLWKATELKWQHWHNREARSTCNRKGVSQLALMELYTYSVHLGSLLHYVIALSRVCLTTAQVANFVIYSACLWTMHRDWNVSVWMNRIEGQKS